MKKIITVAQPALIGNEKKYVADCLKSTWISSIGKYINKFENEFAKFCNVKYAAACSNGTVGLHLTLLAMGVKPGDEIILPTLTYIATANAIVYCNAKPVFVDSDPETWNIDPNKIEDKITKKTKGIIVVHLYGHPVDMDPIRKIAKKHDLFIVEDAAEAHGAEYKKKKVGSIGDIGVFSFFGNKIITTGEGGMVVTNSKKIDGKVRLFKGQGVSSKKRYWFLKVGYNYRMTNIQAALGLAQLEKIDTHLATRRKIANLYFENFKDVKEYISLPVEKHWAKHVFWMFTILLKDNVKISRDKFMLKLQKRGIETRPIFYPIHLLPPYKNGKESYPRAEKISERGISLPTHAGLTAKDISYIAHQVKSICKSNSA